MFFFFSIPHMMFEKAKTRKWGASNSYKPSPTPYIYLTCLFTPCKTYQASLSHFPFPDETKKKDKINDSGLFSFIQQQKITENVIMSNCLMLLHLMGKKQRRNKKETMIDWSLAISKRKNRKMVLKISFYLLNKCFDSIKRQRQAY